MLVSFGFIYFFPLYFVDYKYFNYSIIEKNRIDMKKFQNKIDINF